MKAAAPGASANASNTGSAGMLESSTRANSISSRRRFGAPAAGNKRLSLVHAAQTPAVVGTSSNAPSGRVLELGMGTAGRQRSPSKALRNISQRPLLAQKSDRFM